MSIRHNHHQFAVQTARKQGLSQVVARIDSCFSAPVPHLPLLCSSFPPQEAAELLEPRGPLLRGRASPQRAPVTQGALNTGVRAQLRVDRRKALVHAHSPAAFLWCGGTSGWMDGGGSHARSHLRVPPSSLSRLRMEMHVHVRSPEPRPLASRLPPVASRRLSSAPAAARGRQVPTFHLLRLSAPASPPPHHPHE